MFCFGVGCKVYFVSNLWLSGYSIYFEIRHLNFYLIFFFSFVDFKEFFCLAVGVFWTLLLMFEPSKGRSWVHSWSSLNRWPSLANLLVLLPLSSLLWREKVSLLMAVSLWKLDSTGLSPYASKLGIVMFVWAVLLMYTVFFFSFFVFLLSCTKSSPPFQVASLATQTSTQFFTKQLGGFHKAEAKICILGFFFFF